LIASGWTQAWTLAADESLWQQGQATATQLAQSGANLIEEVLRLDEVSAISIASRRSFNRFT